MRKVFYSVKPIETAVLLLHEGMHAEMRRYLLDNASTSTLPNFPGSITEDWSNYVNERNSTQTAEHDAMSYDEYISFIAEAASDFDNSRMSLGNYKALAWVGVWSYNNQWGEKDSQEQRTINNIYNNAKKKLGSRNSNACE